MSEQSRVEHIVSMRDKLVQMEDRAKTMYRHQCSQDEVFNLQKNYNTMLLALQGERSRGNFAWNWWLTG